MSQIILHSDPRRRRRFCNNNSSRGEQQLKGIEVNRYPILMAVFDGSGGEEIAQQQKQQNKKSFLNSVGVF